MNKLTMIHPSRPSVFISYSHKDQKWLDELLEHLQPLRARNLIDCWSDKDIQTGDKWNAEIEQALEYAMVAVLLVSPGFLASDYITKNELPPLLNKSDKSTLKIIWIPVSASNYKQTEIAVYQSACPPDRPLDTLTKPKRNQAYTQICDIIIKLSNNEVVNHDNDTDKPVTALPKKEIEYKFVHQANRQFKFIATEQVEEIFDKLRTVCDLIDINYYEQTKNNQEDYYYDDENMTLKNCGASFRKRIRNNEFLITIKQGLHSEHAMERFEHEFSCDEMSFNILMSDPKKVEELFRTHFDWRLEIGKLNHLFTVCNERNQMPLETNMGRYLFCYDTYYYYYKKDGRYSEYCYEIEIELESSNDASEAGEDVQLQKLNNSLAILGFTESNKSKFEKGYSFEDDKEKIKNFMCVSLSIVDYARRTPIVQLQILQKLNYFLKEAINKVLGQESANSIIYLPFGSGMTLIFEEPYHSIISVLFRCEKALKNENKEETLRKFEFKTGIHYGPVFKCSDLNENLNFGGSGINISQEIMNTGNNWHILVSPDAYRKLIEENTDIRTYFHEFQMPKLIANIGGKLFNIYNKEQQIGNPERIEFY